MRVFMLEDFRAFNGLEAAMLMALRQRWTLSACDLQCGYNAFFPAAGESCVPMLLNRRLCHKCVSLCTIRWPWNAHSLRWYMCEGCAKAC